jgi:formate dehydrogenase assembly factor FdhD
LQSVCALAESKKEKPFDFLERLTLQELIGAYATLIPSADCLAVKRRSEEQSEDVIQQSQRPRIAIQPHQQQIESSPDQLQSQLSTQQQTKSLKDKKCVCM